MMCLSMVAYSGLALLTDLQVLASLTTLDSIFFPFLFVIVFIKMLKVTHDGN